MVPYAFARSNQPSFLFTLASCIKWEIHVTLCVQRIPKIQVLRLFAQKCPQLFPVRYDVMRLANTEKNIFPSTFNKNGSKLSDFSDIPLSG